MDSLRDLIVDSCEITEKMIQNECSQYSLLFTSPPYCGITDYFMDQWLRLWLLGGPAEPEYLKNSHKGRFCNKDKYLLYCFIKYAFRFKK